MTEKKSTPRYKLIMVGTDTEVFLRDQQTKQPVPAIGLIGGTKHNPKQVPELSAGFCVQEDNVMLEYNVPPAKTKGQFVSNIMVMNNYLTQMLGRKGLFADICSSMEFTKKQLDHPQAQEMGCEPDWDVWSRMVNPSPKENDLMKTVRTSGGHLHISFSVDGKPMTNSEQDGIYLKEPLIKALDLTLGLPSFTFDRDTRRRQLYGKHGAFRNKDYGIEYRTLSNFWTKTPELVAWAFDGVTTAFRLVNNHPKLLENEFGHINEAGMMLRGNDPKRGYNYMAYLLTTFDLLDRANGVSAYSGVSSKVPQRAVVGTGV